MKKAMPHIMILMHFERLESFLMSVEAIFYLKKQMKLKKPHKKEAVYNFLKEKEQNGSLTNEEKKVLKKIDKYLKNFKKDLDKLQKYQYNITHGFDCLFNALDEILEIDNKISQIDQKETENKFTDNMRSMITSLSKSIDKASEIDRKISDDSLSEKFYNTYQLCNKDLNKFALLLRKGVYPYGHMDSWNRSEEESLPDKEYFYSELNKEHITDEDYVHAQKV